MKTYKLILIATCFLLTNTAWSQSPGDLIVTEIMYNPPESGTDSLEYIEIYNSTSSNIDLSGFILMGVGASGNVDTIDPGIIVLAKGRIVFCADSNAMLNNFCVKCYEWSGFGLSNSGETVGIKNAAGTNIDTVFYDDVSPWSTAPDGFGSSLVLCDETVNNDSAIYWNPSTDTINVTINTYKLIGSPYQDCGEPTLTAGFSVSSNCGKQGAILNFSDTSFFISENNTLAWSFPGGNPSSSSSKNPVVQYDSLGSFDVTLIVSNCNKSDTLTKTAYINIYKAGYTVNSVCGKQGAILNFIDTTIFNSANITWTWSFPGGNPSTSSIKNPFVQYDSLGSYDVSLIVSNCNIIDTVTKTAYITIHNMNVFLTATDVSVCDGNDGTAMVSVSGGTTPYNYSWSNSSVSQSATGLSIGYQAISVTDGLVCVVTDSIFINGPALTVNLFSDSVSCFGGNDGSVLVSSISGGASPYTYLWSNGSTANKITSLIKGAYYLTVTDINNCRNVSLSQVFEPDSLTVNLVGDNVSCFGGTDGSINSLPTGGTLPYTYYWSNGMTSNLISALIAGTYTVTIRDANGCSVIENGVITEPAVLSATLTASNVTCNGTNNGIATCVVSGGTPVYIYKWSQGGTSSIISNLAPGSYTVTVKDAGNCLDFGTITITQPTLLVVNVDTVNESQAGANDGSAFASASGGTLSYTYRWSNGAVTQQISNLSAGTYTISVTDANNCLVVMPVIITTTIAINEVSRFKSLNVAIYPVPASAEAILLFNNDKIEDANICLLNSLGQLMESIYVKTFIGENKIKLNLQNYHNGIYFLKIQSESFVSYNKLIKNQQ